MTQIRWVRATFTGAMVGGVVWALIFGVASLHFLAMPWQARTVLTACVVNGVLLVLSWLLWRSSSDEKVRTRAAAPNFGAASASRTHANPVAPAAGVGVSLSTAASAEMVRLPQKGTHSRRRSLTHRRTGAIIDY